MSNTQVKQKVIQVNKKEHPALVQSLVRLAKNVGTEILSLPIYTFAGDHHSPPAYINDSGIHIRYTVLFEEPHNVEVYLAHEIMHPVVSDREKTGMFHHELINIAEDYKINQFIDELYGYDVTKVNVIGLRDKKYDNMSIPRIIRSLHRDQRKVIRKNPHITKERALEVLAPHNCRTQAVLHPLILKRVESLRRKLKHRLNSNILEDFIYSDLEEDNVFYNALYNIHGSFLIKNLAYIDINKTLKGLFHLLYLEKPVAPKLDGKSLLNGQKICYCYPYKLAREHTKGNIENSIIASMIYMMNIDNDASYNRYMVNRLDERVHRYKVRRKKEGGKKNPNIDKIKELNKRIEFARKKIKYYKSLTPLSILLQERVKARDKNKQVIHVASLKHSNSGVQENDVLLPSIENNELIKRLRSCARRSLVDFKQTIKISEDLQDQLHDLVNSGPEDDLPDEKQEEENDQGNGTEEDNNSDQDAEGQEDKDGNNESEKSGDKGKSRKSLDDGLKEGKDETNREDTPKTKKAGSGSGVKRKDSKIEMLSFIHQNKKVLHDILLMMKEIESLMSKSSSRKVDEFGNLYVNYTYGSEIDRTVQSEMGLLANKYTQLEFLSRLANNALLLHAPSSTKRYPVSICIDGSGSMKGNFFSIAVGFALALIKQLHKDRRGAALILFSSSVDNKLVISKEKPMNLMQILRTICTPSYGGTDFDHPLFEAYNIKQQEGWRDMVTILASDGYGIIRNHAKLTALKTANDKIIAALVSNIRSLNGVDELYHIKRKSMMLEMVKIGNEVI